MCGIIGYNVPSHNENLVTGPTVSKKLGLVSGPKCTVQEYFAPFFMFRVLKVRFFNFYHKTRISFSATWRGGRAKRGQEYFTREMGAYATSA